jgi:transposase
MSCCHISGGRLPSDQLLPRDQYGFAGRLRRTGDKEPAAAFVPLMMAPPQRTSAKPAEIRIEVQRGASRVVVSWPVEAAGECAAWLRDWLR